MTIKVSEVSGGPYAHEVDAIRDERYRAKVMNIEPDFDTVFDGYFISPGAAEVIADINKPIEAPVGEFIENVVFNVEEEAPEIVAEESTPESDKSGTEDSASETAVSESGNAEGDADSSVSELDALMDTPIFDSVEDDNDSA